VRRRKIRANFLLLAKSGPEIFKTKKGKSKKTSLEVKSGADPGAAAP